ncbi:MAG: hypothetical protein R2799_10965 [Crocinitomicaceae bacterium]
MNPFYSILFILSFLFSSCGRQQPNPTEKDSEKNKVDNKEIRKNGEDSIPELEKDKDTLSTFSFNEKEIPIFEDAYRRLEELTEKKGYTLVKFEKLAGNFPNLDDFNTVFYDSYTLKQGEQTILILWHVNQFDNAAQTNVFNRKLLQLNLEKMKDSENHKKRFKYWGVVRPKDAILIQTSKDLEDFDPELYGVLYHHFTVRPYK